MGIIYKVDIPFEAITHNLLGTSISFELPEKFELSTDISIVKLNDRWIASLDIDAPSSVSALKSGINSIIKVLSLFAISNASFQIVRSEMSAVKSQKLKEKQIEFKDGNKYLNLIEEIRIKDQLRAYTLKNDFTLENNFLSSKKIWPQSINSALELNYLAVSSHNPVTKFLLLISALEALSYGKLGGIKSILSMDLTSKAKKIFVNDFSELLKFYKISEEYIDRLIANTMNTKIRGTVDHLYEYVLRMGIGHYSKSKIKLWWGYRSDLAHGKIIKDETLIPELSKLMVVVQSSIRKELSG